MDVQDLFVTKTLMCCLGDYLAPLKKAGDYPEEDTIDRLVDAREKIDCLCQAVTDRLNNAMDTAIINQLFSEKAK